MQYQRIPYKAEGTSFETRQAPFSTKAYDVPVIDRPITPAENFKLSWKHQTPVWAPISLLDIDSFMLDSVVRSSSAQGIADARGRREFTDEWGCEWVFVPEAGGPMLKPGTQFLDDITDWEKKVKFPNWKAHDWKTHADEYLKNRNPNKLLSINLGQGCTERLVAILGGYEEAMVAMATEQEAVREFFAAFADNVCEKMDMVKQYYPAVGMVTYHDDWGTERDTFFSEAFFESMVWDATKKIIDHVKASGDICFELHTCGKIERFMNYIADLGVNMLQIQRRANNIPLLKEKYGDKVGFWSVLEGVEKNPDMPLEERLACVRNTIDMYGKNGGIYLTPGAPPDSEAMWAVCYEIYCYSREFYDKERAAATV